MREPYGEPKLHISWITGKWKKKKVKVISIPHLILRTYLYWYKDFLIGPMNYNNLRTKPVIYGHWGTIQIIIRPVANYLILEIWKLKVEGSKLKRPDSDTKKVQGFPIINKILMWNQKQDKRIHVIALW